MEANIAARAEGVEVWPQVSCRPLVFQMNLREPFTFNMRAVVPGADGHARSRSASPRTAIRRGGRARGTSCRAAAAGCRSTSTRSRSRRRRRTRSSSDRKVVEIAPRSGAARRSTSCSTSRSTRTSRPASASVLANNDPDAIARLLPQDTVLLGLADSGAHVSQLCDACFATDLLGNWVRDKEVMPLEHAIHKLTGEPAAVFGLRRPRHARGRQGRRRRRVRRRRRSRPVRCAASATSPPTANGSSPTRPRACATCS